ncbi:MAG: phospholipid/cholesterol/gamma-HCH transport system substrate-binding protein [Thermoleophilaceae bacterium]|nr:phospholipid/cholesterol/gamma-HCH transport system substrate-binding protein [Thermoleophilaceae bacterium]
MNRSRSSGGLAGSPILVGAVTVLVSVIAVFLSYNANSGLPFVPTYDVTVQVQSAAGLVEGNEARIGGKRVGVVDKIIAKPTNRGPIAELQLKLDKAAEPLRSDTQVTVRPRSTLGLKYLEIEPGRKGKTLAEGAKLPLAQSQQVVDLDEVVNAFDASTRKNLQTVVGDLGPGLAGRGVDFNAALSDAPPLLGRVRSVMANLADPRTRLAALVPALERTASAVAPVAPVLGRMIGAADTTLGALSGVRGQLQETISELPPTEAQATRTLRVARPLLTDAELLLRDARPGTRLLPEATARLHHAIGVGLPVLRRALDLADELKTTLGAVDQLASDPLTSTTLQKLDATLASLRPTLDFIAPMQTKCNYLGLWTRNASSSISEGDANGNWFRTLVVAGVSQFTSAATPAPDLHVTTYPHTASPGQDGECEAGNEGFGPGQVIGHPAGNQGRSTETTQPPAGVGKP